MTVHRWVSAEDWRMASTHAPEIDRCSRCRALSAVSVRNPLPYGEGRRMLMKYVEDQRGARMVQAECPETCEETRELLAVLEVHCG